MVRFLQTVESDAPGFPFQPGQVIAGLPRLDKRMREWIKSGVVELLRDEPEDLAVVAPAERAVMRKGRK